MTTTPEVLFVCVHNAGRSQMAAALLDHHADGRVQVRSAGSAPAGKINPAVRAAMAELGLDLSREYPKPLTNDAVQPPTWLSPWAAATPARSTPANATWTGTRPTPPGRASRRSARSATRSTAGSGRCWSNWFRRSDARRRFRTKV